MYVHNIYAPPRKARNVSHVISFCKPSLVINWCQTSSEFYEWRYSVGLENTQRHCYTCVSAIAIWHVDMKFHTLTLHDLKLSTSQSKVQQAWPEKASFFKQTDTMVLTAIVNNCTIEWNKKHQTAKTVFLCNFAECLAGHSCSCENWDSHSTSYKEYCLLGHDTMQFGMFTTPEDGGSKLPQKVWKFLADCRELHSIRHTYIYVVSLCIYLRNNDTTRLLKCKIMNERVLGRTHKACCPDADMQSYKSCIINILCVATFVTVN